MKKEHSLVKTDSRNRVTIPKKLMSESGQFYKVYQKDGKIILEPVVEVHEREKWLFDPKNKPIINELNKALSQKKYIDLGDFKKYLKKKK